MLTALTFPFIQLALNNYLALDPEIKEQLAPLANKILHVEIKDLSLSFNIKTHQDKLELLTDTSEKITTHIRANLLDLGQMAWQSRNRQVTFSKEIEISGDLDFLQKLRDVFLNLDIDWEELISTAVGDIVARQITKTTHNFFNWAQQSITTLNLDLSEYLQEETRLMPTRNELDYFLRDIEILRDDVERLEAKLNLLEG